MFTPTFFVEHWITVVVALLKPPGYPVLAIWVDLKGAHRLVAGEPVGATGHAGIFVWFGYYSVARRGYIQSLGGPDH